MMRVEIRKSTGNNGPKVEIRIRPPRGTRLGLLLVGAAICGLGIWSAFQGSIVSAFAITGFVSLIVLLQVSALPADRATLEDGYFYIQKQVLGIKSSKKLRLSGISNLHYRPKPWYGDGTVPQPSVIFSASEELGLFQGLGLRLKEEEAQRIIQCLEEYRAEVGAASTAIG